MIQTVKTPKGTVLPLTNLKGKQYLMIAYRLQWFNEEVERYNMVTDLITNTEDKATVRATIQVFDKDGKLIRSAQGTKTEHKKDFPDFLEKAETGSLGRTLAMMGFGTQFAISDLDEGNRLADAPVVDTRSIQPAKTTTTSFRKPTVVKTEVITESSNASGWEN